MWCCVEKQSSLLQCYLGICPFSPWEHRTTVPWSGSVWLKSSSVVIQVCFVVLSCSDSTSVQCYALQYDLLCLPYRKQVFCFLWGPTRGRSCVPWVCVAAQPLPAPGLPGRDAPCTHEASALLSPFTSAKVALEEPQSVGSAALWQNSGCGTQYCDVLWLPTVSSQPL